jgi:hypothetical protein
MRRFSKINIPSLHKYGAIKYDFKALKDNLPYFINNTLNRGSSSSPEKVVSLWEAYKKDLYDIENLRKLKNQHTGT